MKGLVYRPRMIAVGMTLLVVGLLFASLLGQFLSDVLGLGNLWGLPDLFDVRMERNVPTLYSAAAMLFCAFLASRAALIDGLRRGVSSARWWVLAAVFLYLALDELFRLHERLGSPLGRSTLGFFDLGPGALFRRTWVLYGLVLALVVGLVCLRLFAGLPAGIRTLFVAAGAVYVFGAVGLELFYARFEFLYGREDTRVFLVLVTAAEEFLEMMGVVIAAYALSSYISLASGSRRGAGHPA